MGEKMSKDEVRYERRTVREWVRKAQCGEIAITDFQRSFVWGNDKTANYVKAIFDGKPVGLYLILEKGNPPQFQPRSFYKMDDIPIENVEELLLDGQQRLTSLLQVLYMRHERRFFIKVRDLNADELKVDDIVAIDVGTARGKNLNTERVAFADNHIPMDVLTDETDADGLTALARWCSGVGKSVGAVKSRVLESNIEKFVRRAFFDRDIWYCWLPASIDRSTATQIFVETNTSSVKIKRFDIEVASARGEYDEDLRNTIRGAYERPESVLRHYFKEDPEEWIPDIGEWLFRVACLRTDKAPRETNYDEALNYLLTEGTNGNFPYLDEIFDDLEWVLKRVAGLGAATRRMVPSWPPIHVLAALRQSSERIKDPVKIDTVRRLLDAYYWRCLFSNRHDVQANDRLYDDFRSLRSALKEIEEQGNWTSPQPAFEEKEHPLYTDDGLLRHASWIGATARLGRALASAVMSLVPRDWVTGEKLTIGRIRELEREGKLDRHHIFPRDLLKKEGVSQERIQNGLNGVILDARTNRRFARRPPDQYLGDVVQDSNITLTELRQRVEEHRVPYEEMAKQGPIRGRYDAFLKKRAELFAAEIRRRGTLPSDG